MQPYPEAACLAPGCLSSLAANGQKGGGFLGQDDHTVQATNMSRTGRDEILSIYIHLRVWSGE